MSEHVDTPETAPADLAADEQPLEERVNNRSQRPTSEAFKAFIADRWGPRPDTLPEQAEVAPFAAARREAVSERFPGDRLVLPAGGLKVRSNDSDFRFRPHSAFAHLTGLGTDREPDAVLVLHPRTAEDGSPDGHDAVLYFRPRAERDTEEFYADARYGELWVGVRPSLEEVEAELGLATAHIDELGDALRKDVGADGVRVRVVPRCRRAGRGRGRRGAGVHGPDRRRSTPRSTRPWPRRCRSCGWSRTPGRSSRCARRWPRAPPGSRTSSARCPRPSRTTAASASSRPCSTSAPGARATAPATTPSPPRATTRTRCTGSATTARCTRAT